ncbi:hypothetical protein C7972_10274 [Arenibacter sp. ARW7G5Y1]|nr:hypothetical protein C7972_10274 [Arenibacter sp. ARW7G5Y1]
MVTIWGVYFQEFRDNLVASRFIRGISISTWDYCYGIGQKSLDQSL